MTCGYITCMGRMVDYGINLPQLSMMIVVEPCLPASFIRFAQTPNRNRLYFTGGGVQIEMLDSSEVSWLGGSTTLSMLGVPGDVRYTCTQCDYSTASIHYLEKHMRRHIDRNLQCPFCSYVSKQRGHLNQHIKCHTEDKLQCSYCDFRTHWKSNLVRHVTKHHPHAHAIVLDGHDDNNIC